MKLALRTLFILVLCFGGVVAASAQQQKSHPAAVSIGGVYGGFTVGSESGDLSGMRVVILAAGGKWRAIVQIAEGGAEDPAPNFVDVTASAGNKVAFSVGDRNFTGTVSAAGLRLKDEGLLRRRPCAAYFSVGP